MQKKMGQLSFADSLVNGGANFLSEVGTVLDWSFLEQELSGIYSSGAGRPSYPLRMGDEQAVYADKAYDKRARRKALEGLENQLPIMSKACD